MLRAGHGSAKWRVEDRLLIVLYQAAKDSVGFQSNGRVVCAWRSTPDPSGH